MIADPGAVQAVPCLPLELWFPNSSLMVPVVARLWSVISSWSAEPCLA